MRKAIAIFTATVILLSSMSNAVLVAKFKLNQAEIERLYCVNKAKPEIQCHGKCHLQKQLSANNDHQGQPTPTSQLEDAVKINFFCQQDLFAAAIFTEGESQPTPVGCNHFMSRLFGKSLFQPPDNQPFV
ncbi:MAG: hypothetical protein K9J37_09520 [Saprospiraceae bacterium]|nr:hypothetical protein [Saprospiraceae bacterium]MCF8250142.1 hypothetical protein [Saprospiraceae bacterium]MCF8279406.1 hypothetical protein [Bacteroidales bacterium]MCF8311196.1 hypothetical protein [Saprospiraceae bacterium]MCF8440423.1 hypothetical protein [Saprospiraceae bacterium]